MKTFELSNFNNLKILPAVINGVPRENIMKFTPSICHFRDDLYILSYRVWIDKKRRVPKKPGDPGHPWFTSFQGNSFDGTGFALLKIESKLRITVMYDIIRSVGDGILDMRIYNMNGNIKCIFNSYQKKNPIEYKNNFQILKKKKDFEYSCFKVIEDDKPKTLTWERFERMYNPITDHKFKKIWQTYWDNVCAMMYMGTLSSSFTIRETRFICPKIQNRLEKNWAPFMVNDKLYFQYATEEWSFIEYNTCNKILPSNSSIFKRLKNIFKYVRFSCSTPLVPFGNYLLGVGHYKMKYMESNDNKKLHPQIRKFLEQIKQRLGVKRLSEVPTNQHTVYHVTENKTEKTGFFYGLYFYTVNPKTLQLHRFSPAYLIQSNPRITMSYPSGLEKKDDTYMLTYHEADSSVWLKMMSKNEIEDLLVYTNSTKMENFEFKIFKNTKPSKVKTAKMSTSKVKIDTSKIGTSKVSIAKMGTTKTKDQKVVKISCILPSYNRHDFIDHCIKLLHEQRFEYPHEIELIIVDDSPKKYVLNESKKIKIKHIVTTRKSIGEKRNIAVKNSTGDYIVHWDDDDWYAPNRISYQLKPIIDGKADMTCLTDFKLYNICEKKMYKMTKSNLKRYFAPYSIQGGTLCYKRELWGVSKYPHTSLAEDIGFVYDAKELRNKKLKVLSGKDYYIYIRHNNTYKFNTKDNWKILKEKIDTFYDDIKCE